MKLYLASEWLASHLCYSNIMQELLHFLRTGEVIRTMLDYTMQHIDNDESNKYVKNVWAETIAHVVGKEKGN